MSIYDSIYLGERLIIFISPHPFVFKIASSPFCMTNKQCGAEHNGEQRFVIFTVFVFLPLSLSSF